MITHPQEMGRMKSMVELTLTVLREVGDSCGVRTHRDALTIASRIEKEGLSFLTITLPMFEKSLTAALEHGTSPTPFVGFSTNKRSGLPSFLKGFLEIIFLTDVSSVEMRAKRAMAVKAVRQLCLLHSKVELDCTPGRKAQAVQSYISTDAELVSPCPELLAEFRLVAIDLFGSYLRDVDSHFQSGRGMRHSSGSLASRESYNSRFALDTWTERLQAVVPYWDNLSVNWRDASLFPPTILSTEDERPAKLTLVPKTMKSPRVIAMEPAEQQYAQQGLLASMTAVLSQPKHISLYEQMCWADQGFNRQLARKGSIDGSIATIDLSEASDRVHFNVALSVLSSNLFVRDLAQASRSTKISVFGELIELNKFASMGSALCFPVETMVFLTIVHMGLRRLGITQRSVANRDVRVYGDDIIVPVESAPTICDLLEAMGLKVNRGKTFWNSMFRESCGSDWFDGFDVSVVRQRAPIPADSHRYSDIARGIDFHNRLHNSGLLKSAQYVAGRLRRLRDIPSTPPGTAGVALWSYDESKWRVRVNPDLQRLEYRVLQVQNLKPKDPLFDQGALRKCLTHSGIPREVRHLERDGRSQPVSMKVGWTVGP